MTRYAKPQAGEKIFIAINQHNYKMACCDCGLVHTLRFRFKRSMKLFVSGRLRRVNTLIMQVWRNERATGQMRRRNRQKESK